MERESEGKRERRRKERTEATFEAILLDDFPKLMSDTNPQMQRAQRTPRRINDK